jgi:SNF2 family DNA or RNA helicase
MNLLLNEKIIKQMCGETAFKKGEIFNRTRKVQLETEDISLPIIRGVVNEEFNVTVQNDGSGDFPSSCTCPKLASYNKSCQHIAAVLINILDRQKQFNSSTLKKDDLLADELLGLFGNHLVKPSGNQSHFEARTTLNVTFICKPVQLKNNQFLIGIEAQAGTTKLVPILKIRDFLEHIEKRRPFSISAGVIYNPELHGFPRDTDKVFQKLIDIYHDEKLLYGTLTMSNVSNEHSILIPPSAWEDLLPGLLAAPSLIFEHHDIPHNGIHLSKEMMPINFEFKEGTMKGYTLDVLGLNLITIFETYGYVLFENRWLKLSGEDINRLVELKQLLVQTGKNQIIIPDEQIELFVETVIPRFMKLGHVRIDKAVSERLVTTPLKAKLFLDRVKNRLLVGLEFHYGNLVINPVEGEDSGSIPLIRRDGEKEKQILQLIEESSFTKTDGGYYLHNEEAEYHFLNHVVPKLKKLVQVYATTAVKLRLLKENSIGPLIRADVNERTNWLEFRFDISGIPESEIKKLLKSLEEKRKYYRMQDGSLLSLETKAFQNLNRFLEKTGLSQGEVHRLPLPLGIQLANSLKDGEIITIGDSFRKILSELKTPNEHEFPVPDHLNSVLRSYQKDGFRWLKTLAKYHFGGILADDMGLGKTLQSIAFIVSVLPEIREVKLPILIVTPSSLVYNWLNELKKFAPEIRVNIIEGTRIERSHAIEESGNIDVMITSYPLLRRDSKSYQGFEFHTMIMDEAQAFKNPTTQTAKAVKLIQAKYRFALSGTPIENSIEELWSIFHVVFPNLLPGRKDFSELRKENIARRVRPFILRRLKEDVLKELPEKLEFTQSRDLLPEQKKLYTAYLSKLRHETLKHLNKETLQKNRIRILAGLTRLRQLCCHPALFIDDYKGSSAKFEQLMEIVNEARTSGKRLLIFSQFTQMLSIIGREFAKQGIPYFYLDGQTPSFERVELCNRYNEGERDFFLISLKAGGTGLNLTGADTVILYDLWWNPAVEEQAADRAHRMGQKNVVNVIKLVAYGTIEEKINELQAKKRGMIEEMLQVNQDHLAGLTDQDIKEILMI